MARAGTACRAPPRCGAALARRWSNESFRSRPQCCDSEGCFDQTKTTYGAGQGEDSFEPPRDVPAPCRLLVGQKPVVGLCIVAPLLCLLFLSEPLGQSAQLRIGL